MIYGVADKQSTGLFGPSDKLHAIFSIFKPTALIKKKGYTAGGTSSFLGAGDGT